jgi:hypothetical protein
MLSTLLGTALPSRALDTRAVWVHGEPDHEVLRRAIRSMLWMLDGERPAGPAHTWPSGPPGRRRPRPARRATVRIAGPALLPAPGATSASGITKITHDLWALHWIADAVSRIRKLHADTVPAAPELWKGQTSTVDRRSELSAGPHDCPRVADWPAAPTRRHGATQCERSNAVAPRACTAARPESGPVSVLRANCPSTSLRRYVGPPAARIVITRSRSGPVRPCSPTKTARSLAWMT